MKVETREKGALEVLAIWTKEDGTWEPDWEPLRELPFASLLTVVSKDTMEHALKGWSFPLIDALGIPPEGALRKMPVEARECGLKDRCAIYNPATCRPLSKQMPVCYEPGGIESDHARRKAAEVVQLWREGVYVIVVNE